LAESTLLHFAAGTYYASQLGRYILAWTRSNNQTLSVTQ